MNFKNSGLRITAYIIAGIIIVVGAYFLLPYLLKFTGYLMNLFLPFILGYIFSLAINPLADRLQSKLKLPRGLSAILMIILTVGIAGGIVTAIVWKFVDEIRSLYSHYPQIYQEAVQMWDNLSEKFSDFYIAMPDTARNMLDNMGKIMSESITDFFSRTPFVEKAGNIAKGLPGIFISIIVFFLSLYFMVTDARTVKKFFGKIIPVKASEKLVAIRTELKKYLGGYVKAQMIIMGIAFVIIFTGLSILKIDYALLIALGIAFLDALPFFGSGAALWPWAIVSFLNGSIKIGVGLIIIYLAIVFTRQMIEPKVVSNNIGVKPILTLMAMYVGFKTFSIGGLILGPVLLIIIVSFYKAGIFAPIINLFKKLFILMKYEYIKLKNIFK